MITFLQDNDGWACISGSTTLGRITETSDGVVLALCAREPETFPDVEDAQARVLDIYDPYWRQADAAAFEDARKESEARERDARAGYIRRSAQPRYPKRKTPWKGGPKQGTQYARAEIIRDRLYKRDHLAGRDLWDNRGRSEGHARAYQFAKEAASLLAEAQGMSPFPACRRIEGNLRGKAARLLSKAEALMPGIRDIDGAMQKARLAELDGVDDPGLSL